MQSTGVIRWTGGMSPPSPRSFRTQIGGRADWKGWKPERLSGMQRLRLPVGPSVWTVLVWFGRLWTVGWYWIGAVRGFWWGGSLSFGPGLRAESPWNRAAAKWMHEWVSCKRCMLIGGGAPVRWDGSGRKGQVAGRSVGWRRGRGTGRCEPQMNAMLAAILSGSTYALTCQSTGVCMY